VEEFAKIFFRPKQFQAQTDHAAMHRILNEPVERFEALSEEKQEQFRSNLVAFRNLYSFMSQIIPFQDADLEKLYAFIRLLVPRLPKRGIGPAVVIDDEVSFATIDFSRRAKALLRLLLETGEPFQHLPQWEPAKTATSRSNFRG